MSITTATETGHPHPARFTFPLASLSFALASKDAIIKKKMCRSGKERRNWPSSKRNGGNRRRRIYELKNCVGQMAMEVEALHNGKGG